MKWYQRVNRWTMTLSGLATVTLVFLTAEQVIARYFFKASSVAIQEMQWHLFGFIFLISASATLSQNQHVRVDILYGRLTKKRRAVVDFLGSLLFLLPSMAVLVWFGVQDVLAARDFLGAGVGSDSGFVQFLLKGEGSPDPGGLPARWIVKAFLPLGALLVLVQGVFLLIENMKTILSKSEGSHG